MDYEYVWVLNINDLDITVYKNKPSDEDVFSLADYILDYDAIFNYKWEVVYQDDETIHWIDGTKESSIDLQRQAIL